MSDEAPEWPSEFTEPRQSPGFVFWCDFMRWQRGVNDKLRPLGLTQPQFALLAVYGWFMRKQYGVTQQAVVSRMLWKFPGGVLRACEGSVSQAARSRGIGSMG